MKKSGELRARMAIFEKLSFRREFRDTLHKAHALVNASRVLQELGDRSGYLSMKKKASRLRRTLIAEHEVDRVISGLVSGIRPDQQFSMDIQRSEWPENIQDRMPDISSIMIRKWNSPISSSGPIRKIYTDGSFHSDGGIGIVGVDAANHPCTLISGFIQNCPGSYEAEYAGVLTGMKLIGHAGVRKLVHDVSADIARDAVKSAGYDVECLKVSGHSGYWYNEIADILASASRK